MDNNFAELTGASVDFSSELSSFPSSNATNKFRSKVWKPSGYFKITSGSNDKLYINDGSDKTVTITAGEYTSGSALATQIQTDLNAASSNWTVTYDDTTTPTYKFIISNSGSVTLRFSQSTDAIWDDIGYIGSTDDTGTSFEADVQRNHMYEYIRFDMGFAAELKFFACISPLDQTFSIADSAEEIKLMANNSDIWDNPPLTITLTRHDNGIFKFFDEIEDTSYRFWRFQWKHRTQGAGPSAVSIGHIYLGDYLTLTERNISKGYNRRYVDPSIVSQSVSGARYYDEKTKSQNINGASIQYIDKDDRLKLEQMFFDFGKTIPFYISLDPTTCFTDELQELTKYVFFANEPVLTQVRHNTYTVTNMNFLEAI
jgi:hypothetical protein